MSLYVMTAEFGAATQLEKIDMLDFADVVAVNKYEQRAARTPCATCAGSSGAAASASSWSPRRLPVFGTIASQFNDAGRERPLRRPRRAAGREVRHDLALRPARRADRAGPAAAAA